MKKQNKIEEKKSETIHRIKESIAITMSATRKQVSRTPTQSFSSPVDCCSCQKPIRERYLLKALDQYWHEDCLKCSCCEVRLGEVGSTLFSKANLILCKRDYLRYVAIVFLTFFCFDVVFANKEKKNNKLFAISSTLRMHNLNNVYLELN